MKRLHDAELCERIRELEQRVAELEAPRTIVYPAIPHYPHYCWSGCPQHYGTGYPTWISNGTSINNDRWTITNLANA